MCQAPQTINRFIVSPSPRSFFFFLSFFLCNIRQEQPTDEWGGGWWWLVSTSPGVWNALNLIHSRAPDIQHRTADSPDVIGSQGNLQLSQDLGGFLNSPSEFLQQKKKGKERRRGVLIFLETRSEIAGHHMAALTGTNFFLRGRKKRKSRTRRRRKPQTANRKRIGMKEDLNWLVPARVSGTSHPIHSGNWEGENSRLIRRVPIILFAHIVSLHSGNPSWQHRDKIKQSNWLPLKGLLRKHIGTHTHTQRDTHTFLVLLLWLQLSAFELKT